MSYQTFYSNSLGGGIDGYGGNYSNYGLASTAGYGIGDQEVFLGGNSGFGQQAYAGGGGYNANAFEQQSSAATASYSADAQGLFRDPNPQIIRRPASGGTQTYMQRVIVKFLQPPPLPPPGPLIVREVRPPQLPPPPPLYIRQRPPPPPILPPMVIREAPPRMPPAVGTQVITRMLPPLPVPPRSVIIERLPPLPPRPRDVVVERWLPYRAQQKRRVIVQRAPPAVIPKPRNIIIYYEAPKTQVVRRFQNLGVQMVNPADYVARYGTQLEDTQTLVSHARQAGVIEDISPPVGAGSMFQSSGYENYQSNSNGLGGISYGNTAGFGSSLGGFNNPIGLSGGNSSYESYSAQQTFS